MNGRRRPVLGAAIVLLTASSCFFNADLPLRNDPPECVNHSEINVSLDFPENAVCTLSISDLNDSTLDVSSLSCIPAPDDSIICPDTQPLPWPGGFRFLATGYGTKQLQLLLDTNRLGLYRGILLISDASRATLRIPYTIDTRFYDPFDTYPLSADLWDSYVSDDSLHLGFDFIDRKLVFSFSQSDDPLAAPLTAGIHSRFSIGDRFSVMVDFKLRDEMDEAFEVGFFVSTSPDTGRWSGERAGVFISGVNGRLRFECRSVNLQSYSYDTGLVAGKLGISRSDSTIRYFLHDGNPAVSPTPRALQYYPAEVPVYIHLKMTIFDQSRNRNCTWNDLVIPLGTIEFSSRSH